MKRSEWEMLDRFLVENYHERYILRDRRFSEWCFGEPGDPENLNVLVMWDGDELLGMLGFMPAEVMWAGRVVRGTWTANWHVARDHRYGTGVLLLRRLTEEYDVVLGQGAGPQNIRVTPRMGFSYYPKLARYVRILDETAVREYVEPSMSESEFSWRVAGQRHACALRPEEADLAREIPDRFRPENYRPSWSEYPEASYGTVRSAEFLNHRYLEHPCFRYQGFVAGPSDHPAVLIFRVESVRDCTRLNVRVVELLFSASADGILHARGVLRRLEDEAIRVGAGFVDFVCPAKGYRELLYEAGYVEGTDLPLPLRYNPLDRGWKAQNLILWSAPSLGSRPPLSEWYVTKGDGDQDRPNP